MPNDTTTDLRRGVPDLRRVLSAAWPIMLGYVAIGIPCGILCNQVGMKPWMCLFMSLTFYSGAGQFMLPNLWMAGASLQAIIASISLVNTRQMLYAASFAPTFARASAPVALAFSATVTDESFGVNTERFNADPTWKYTEALLVNIASMSSWALSNFAGAIAGEIIPIPTAIASFAMTSIFICLLISQTFDKPVLLCVIASFAGVYAAKALGVGGAAIVIGALLGVSLGWIAKRGEAA